MAFLRTTANAFLGEHKVGGFPLILKEDWMVDGMSSEYLLDQYREGCAVSSLKTYGGHLVDFISQLEVDGLAIDDISDNWLTAYKAAVIGRGVEKDNTKNYASQIIRTVIHYIFWLEERGYIKGVVGEKKGFLIRITKDDKGRIHHPLAKFSKKDKRSMPAPLSCWIQEVKKHGPQRLDLHNRFCLMIDWGKAMGLRAMEVCNLKVRDLPSLDTAEKAIADGREIPMTLYVTKGGHEEPVNVSPYLIKSTWGYIISDREVVVRKFRDLDKAFDDLGYVFLSDKTGLSLSPKAYSNSVRKAFLRAVDKGGLTIDEKVWVHGLRHHFVVKLLRGLDESDITYPDELARMQTRHGSVDAMKPYTSDRFNGAFDG